MSNGNQKSEPAEMHLFGPNEADDGVLAILDRARVDFVAHTKGRHRIMDQAAAHAVKSKQRKYQPAPIPRPPTVQTLLKPAGHLEKKLKADPAV